MKHKYWVHFMIRFGTPEQLLEGGMGIYREQPITDPGAIEEIKQAVANQIAMDLKLPEKTPMGVMILGWSKFENLIEIARPH